MEKQTKTKPTVSKINSIGLALEKMKTTPKTPAVTLKKSIKVPSHGYRRSHIV